MKNLSLGIGIGILTSATAVSGVIAIETIHQSGTVGIAQSVPFEALSYCDQLDAIARSGKSVSEFVINSGRFDDYAWAVRQDCNWHQEQINVADSVLNPPVLSSANANAVASSQQNCHPAYPDICIAPPPPDLDCGDISSRNFRVVGSDPHRFDGDRDGIGCEQ